MPSLRVVFLVLVFFAMTNESAAYATSCPEGSTLVHQMGWPTSECIRRPHYCYCAEPCTNDQIKYKNTCQDCAVANAVPSEENLNDSGERTSCECSNTSAPFDGFLEPTVLNCVSTSACAKESGFFCEAAMIACDDGCEKGFVYADNSDTGYPTHNVEVDAATVEIGKLPVGYDDTTSGLWSVRLNHDETRGVLVNKATATVQLWDTSTGAIFKTLPTQIISDVWLSKTDCGGTYTCLADIDIRSPNYVNPTAACWSKDHAQHGVRVFVAHSTGIAKYEENSGWNVHYTSFDYTTAAWMHGGVLDCIHTDYLNGPMESTRSNYAQANAGERLIVVRPDAIIEVEDTQSWNSFHTGCNDHPNYFDNNCDNANSNSYPASPEPYCKWGCHYYQNSAGFEKIDITNDQSKIISMSMTNGNQRLFTWNRATLQRTEHTTVDMWSSLHAGLRCSLAQPCLRGVAFARGGQKAYVAQPNGIRLYDLTDGSSEVVDLSKWSTEGEYHYTVPENTLYSGSQASYIDTTSIFVDASGKYAYITDPNTNGGAGAVRKVELGVRLGIQSTQCDAEHCCPGDGFKYNISDPICPIGCPPGQELDGNSACIPCAQNYWKDHHGQEACSPCRVNSGTDGQTGSNAANLCKCIPGYYNEGSAVDACLPCPVGTYKQTFANQLACDACNQYGPLTTVGEASDEIMDCVCDVGASGDAYYCTSCPANTYKPSVGSNIACTPCFTGSTSPAGSTSIDACTCEAPFVTSNQACVCDAGYTYSDPTKDLAHACGDAQTSACPTDGSGYHSGSYGFGKIIDGSTSSRWVANGDSNAQSRGATWVKIDMEQVRSIASVRIHPDGTSYWYPTRANGIQVRVGDVDDPYSNPICGTQASFYAGMGSDRWSTLSCSASGRFLFLTWPAECSGANQCNKVSVAEVQIFAPDCLACDTDTYKAEPGDQACTSCPESTSHELLAATSAAACECDPGLHYNEGVCEACPVNTYKTNVGNTACVPCPANTHSAAGSTAVWQCVPKSGFYGSGANLLACPNHTTSSDTDPATASVNGTAVEACVCEQGYGPQVVNIQNIPQTEECIHGADMNPDLGCVEGWYSSSNRCIQQSTSGVNSWHTAKQACIDVGAELAVPRDAEDNNFFISLNGGTFWLGVNDLTTEGVYVSSTEEPLTYTAWKSGEPNNYGGNEDCSTMKNGAWNDNSCYHSAYNFRYFCEKPYEPVCKLRSVSCPICEAGKFKDSISTAECSACPENKWSVQEGSTSETACECVAGYAGSSVPKPAAFTFGSKTFVRNTRSFVDLPPISMNWGGAEGLQYNNEKGLTTITKLKFNSNSLIVSSGTDKTPWCWEGSPAWSCTKAAIWSIANSCTGGSTDANPYGEVHCNVYSNGIYLWMGTTKLSFSFRNDEHHNSCACDGINVNFDFSNNLDQYLTIVTIMRNVESSNSLEFMVYAEDGSLVLHEMKSVKAWRLGYLFQYDRTWDGGLVGDGPHRQGNFNTGEFEGEIAGILLFDSILTSSEIDQARNSFGCTACASSTYKATIGNVPCTDCGSNMDSAVASTDASQCTCVAGSVPSENGGCEMCPENTYVLDGDSTCTACLANAVSSVGSTSESACECIAAYTFGCPDGWVSASETCIQLSSTTTADWNIAKQACIDIGAQLAWPRNAEDNQLFYDTNNGYTLWIGVTDSAQEGVYTSVTGEPITYFKWHSGYPSNWWHATAAPQGSDCIAQYAGHNAGWLDKPCWGSTYNFRWFCEVPKACILCAADTYKSTVGNDACTPCAAGYVAAAGSTECVSATCQDGYVMDESYNCVPCAADTYFTTSLVGSSCQACPENSVTVGTAKIGKSSCLCALGYYGTNGGPCAACGENEYTPEVGSATCTALPSGQGVVTEYVVAFTATLATTVEAFDKQAFRSAMTQVFGVALEQVRVKDVRAVYSSSGGGAIRRLLSDSIEVDTEIVYETSTARDAADVSVLTTSATNSALSTESASFTATSFSAVEYNTLSTLVCGPGSYPKDDACELCSVGTYKYNEGNHTCYDCKKSPYCFEQDCSISQCVQDDYYYPLTDAIYPYVECRSTPHPGSTTECVCAAGWYSYPPPNDMLHYCVKCQEGKYKDVASDSTQCLACTEHASSPRASSSITNCTCIEGFFGDHTGCTPALIGHWASNGELFACPGNSTTASIGSSSPMDCNCLPGFTLGLNSECVQCNANTYKNETSNSLCSACPANSMSAPGSQSVLNCQCEQFYKKVQTGSQFECHMDCPAGYEEKYEEVMYCPADEVTTQCFQTYQQPSNEYDVTLPITYNPVSRSLGGGGWSSKCCSPELDAILTWGEWQDPNKMLAKRFFSMCNAFEGNCTLQRSTTCLPCNRQHYKANAGGEQCQPCFGHYLGLSPHDGGRIMEQSLTGWADYSDRYNDAQARNGYMWNLSYQGGYNTGGSEYPEQGPPLSSLSDYANIGRISAMSVWLGREYDIWHVSGAEHPYGTMFETAKWNFHHFTAYAVYPSLTSVPYDSFGAGITGCFCRQGFYNTTVLPPNGEGCTACEFGKFNSHWNSSTCHTCYTENPTTLQCEVTNVSWNFGTFCAREEMWENYDLVRSKVNDYDDAKKFYAWWPITSDGVYHTFDFKMCKVEPGTQVYDWNVRNYPMRLPHTVWSQTKILHPDSNYAKAAIFYSHPPPESGVESCPPNTWNNGSFMQCQPCANSVFDGIGATSASECVCLPGFTQVDDACVGCEIGSFSSATSNDACTACSSVRPHSTTLAGGATSPDQCVCEPGFTLQDGLCVACPSGATKHVAGNEACVQCPDNGVLPVGSPHQIDSCRCNAGYAGDQFGCSACPLNFVKADAGNTDCEPCGVGFQAPYTAGTTCVSAGCQKGKRKKAGATTCTSCLQGKFKADWGDQECTTCSGARSRSKRGASSAKDCACPGKQIALAVEPAIIKELGAFIEDESTLQTTECTSSCTIQADSNRALKSISVDAGASDVHISVDGVLVFSCTSDCSRFIQELNMPNAQNEIQYTGSGTIVFKFYTEREIIFESEPAWMAGNRAAARKLVLKSKLRPGQGLYSRTQSKFNSEKCVPCVRGLICKDYAIEEDEAVGETTSSDEGSGGGTEFHACYAALGVDECSACTSSPWEWGGEPDYSCYADISCKDANGDGSLDFSEWETWATNQGAPSHLHQCLFDGVDTNQDTKLNAGEVAVYVAITAGSTCIPCSDPEFLAFYSCLGFAVEAQTCCNLFCSSCGTC